MGKNWKYTKLFYTLFILLLENKTGKAELSAFIGCNLDENLCLEDEVCYDDKLFGNCQNIAEPTPDIYEYDLDLDKLTLLQSELERLKLDGYSWENIYTQCVLGNILNSFRFNLRWDETLCEIDEADTLAYDDIPMDVYDYLRDKKDEFVEIHKYFKDDDKRGNKYLLEEELQFDPSIDSNDLIYNDNFNRLISQLSPEDLVSVIQDFSGETYPRKEKRFEDSQLYYPDGDSKYSTIQEVPDEPMMQLDELPSDDEEGDIVKYEDEMGEDEVSGLLQDALIEDERFLDDNTKESIISEQLPPSFEIDESDIISKDPDILPIDNEGNAESDEGLPEANQLEVNEEDDDMQDTTLTPEEAAVLSAILREQEASAANKQGGNADFGEYNDLPKDYSYLYEDYKPNEGPIIDENEKAEDLEIPDEPKETILTDEVIKKSDEKKKAVKKEQMDDEISDNEAGSARIKVISTKFDAKRVHMTPKKAKTDYTDYESETPKTAKFKAVDGNYAFVQVHPKNINYTSAVKFVNNLEKIIGLPTDSLIFETVHDGEITFYINQLNLKTDNATAIASQAMTHASDIKNATGYAITNAGMGRETKVSLIGGSGPKYFVLTFVLCGCVAGIVIAVVTLYIVKSYSRNKNKLKEISKEEEEHVKSSKDYEDLCRQHMQSKSTEKQEGHNTPSRINTVNTTEVPPPGSPTNRSSTSSWSEEPVQTNMDISTGHIVLSYMEDHLKNKDRLDEEWEALCAYEAEPSSTDVASEPANMRKNRYSDALPYDHSRVVLNNSSNVSSSDYINASTIMDHDPRNPAFVATQGPLPHTVADFWQMIWEQGSVVIVQLTKLTDHGVGLCHRYWPEEGSDLYHIYEVHLVSEHIWCDDYLVRSFYLKNLQTNETRTVTQFHFLTWPENDVPSSSKALLDFRRKVNKSYRGRSCPIVVHCSDGIGRTGTYCLIDMVLNRLNKGAKEIDIAATLEHIRDQRMNAVKTKEQFEFALAAVAEEVHAVLKALPQ